MIEPFGIDSIACSGQYEALDPHIIKIHWKSSSETNSFVPPNRPEYADVFPNRRLIKKGIEGTLKILRGRSNRI